MRRDTGPMEQTILQGDAAERAASRRLRVMTSAKGPSAFDLEGSGVYVLGRGGDWRVGDLPCAVDDGAISRRHAALRVGATVQVEDLGSTNGTWLRGRRLEVGERVDLLPGDVFSLGTDVLCVYEAPHSPLGANQVWTFSYFEGRLADECQLAASRRGTFAVMQVRVDGELRPEFPSALVGIAGIGAVIAVDAPGKFLVLRAVGSGTTATEEAQRLQRALREAGWGARVGAALFPSDGQNSEQLVSAARGALRAPALSATSSEIVIENARMRDLYALIDRVARGAISVLILGETGVGKEVVAREIHARSTRSKGPFQAINCAALPETLVESELFGYHRGAFSGAQHDRPGIFERAHGGTVFLDEIGEIPLAVQVKLLRVLESRTVRRLGGSAEVPFDVRLLAATNRDLEREIEDTSAPPRFRADLFFRLNGFPLTIPPLRDRPDEIEPLALTFAAAVCARDTPDVMPEVTRGALDAMRGYAWPGNIRELRNVIERAVFLSETGVIEREHLPEKVLHGVRSAARAPGPVLVAPSAEWPSLTQVLDAAELEHVRKTLERCQWNQTKAAVQLDVSRMTLITKMKKYGIKTPGR
jgi:two-component system response regulator AtoC